MTGRRLWPGQSSPLGATWDGGGVNFALFSEHATAVELYLFDDAEGPERERLALPELRLCGEAMDDVYAPSGVEAVMSVGETAR